MSCHQKSLRRRSLRASGLLLLALPFLACGDGDEGLAPYLRTPDLGIYGYDAVIQITDSTADTLSGTVEITVASEDSIIGVWTVTGYNGNAQRGPWNINAYALPAQPTGPQSQNRLVTHRVWRKSSSPELECQVAYRHILAPEDTFISSTLQNSCLLARAQ